jgi:hypothetical protein
MLLPLSLRSAPQRALRQTSWFRSPDAPLRESGAPFYEHQQYRVNSFNERAQLAMTFL